MRFKNFFYVIGKSYNVKKRSARMRTRAKKKFVASDRARREISAITEIFFILFFVSAVSFIAFSKEK